jgi:hypothetical protein
MSDAPQAVMIVDRKGNIVATNIEAVIAWRKEHEPEAYKAAMDALVDLLTEALVDQIVAEQADQQRVGKGFAYFACHRLEHRIGL